MGCYIVNSFLAQETSHLTIGSGAAPALISPAVRNEECSSYSFRQRTGRGQGILETALTLAELRDPGGRVLGAGGAPLVVAGLAV